jgi:hypothetical protein
LTADDSSAARAECALPVCHSIADVPGGALNISHVVYPHEIVMVRPSCDPGRSHLSTLGFTSGAVLLLHDRRSGCAALAHVPVNSPVQTCSAISSMSSAMTKAPGALAAHKPDAHLLTCEGDCTSPSTAFFIEMALIGCGFEPGDIAWREMPPVHSPQSHGVALNLASGKIECFLHGQDLTTQFYDGVRADLRAAQTPGQPPGPEQVRYDRFQAAQALIASTTTTMPRPPV